MALGWWLLIGVVVGAAPSLLAQPSGRPWLARQWWRLSFGLVFVVLILPFGIVLIMLLSDGAFDAIREGANLFWSDGFGWVSFDDYELARTIGIVALSLILFEGGLTTGFHELRPVMWPAMSLALIGTLLTAALTGLAAKALFDFTTLEAMLVGSILAATDAVILSVLADGVLLVVRSGETPKEAFVRTRDLLASVKCRVLGVVLNAVDSSAPDYYYSYRYYPYSYGYGPQESQNERQDDEAHALALGRRGDPDDDAEVL